MSASQSKAKFSSCFPNHLCETCRSINAESVSAPNGILFLAPGETIAQNPRRTQCRLCQIVDSSYSFPEFSRIDSLLTTNQRGWMLQLGYDHQLLNSTSVILHTEKFGPEEVPKSLEFGLFVRVLPGDPAHHHGVTPVKHFTNTGSESSLEIARSWVEHCNSHHKCLHSGMLPSFGPRVATTPERQLLSPDQQGVNGPKRLIDLMAFGRDSLDARLIEEAVNGSMKYATLSYCWGTSSTGNFTTTTATLASRKERIECSLLPLTLQQAFEVTRYLDIRYIWIDALCILQDSESDWQDESARMGMIYSRSFVTIAADWGSDVSSGLFKKVSANILMNKDELFNTPSITSILSNGLESTLYLTEPIRSEFPEIQESALNTRAWAYQERLLSPRILHFTETQLFWECKEDVFAADGVPRSYGQIYPYPGIITKLLKNRSEREGLKHRMEGLLNLWYMYLIAGGYATRAITISSDKLPALSALSEAWSQHLKVPYLAGLWHFALPYGLSWYRVGPLGARPSTYRAPSWSWASLDGDVAWEYWAQNMNMGESIIRVEEAHVSLQGKSPFGQVDGGHIIICGLLNHFHVVSRDHKTELYTADGKKVGRAHMDTDADPRTLNGLLLMFTKVTYGWLPNIPDPERYGGEGFILLLEPVPSNPDELPVFVRVGISDCASYNEESAAGRGLADPRVLFQGCKMQRIKIL